MKNKKRKTLEILEAIFTIYLLREKSLKWFDDFQ